MVRHCLLLLLAASLILPILSCAQSGGKKKLPAREFSQQIANSPNALILDVRTPEEFGEGHLEDALNIDYRADEFEQAVSKLDKSKPVYVYCRSGGRSAGAALHMRQSGFGRVYELKGGIIAWKKAGLAVKR
jgi:rhodanese-related sulfurtransferase